MRNVRSAQHGYRFVITFMALLFLTATPLLAAPHPRTTILKAAEPVRNEYLIMLNVPANDVPKVAAELTKRYGGEVLAVWQHAVKGFWLKAEPEVVGHMIQDRRILSCEENAVGHESGTPQPTAGPLATPGPNQTYPRLSGPDDEHYLWHLDRISHREKPVAAADFNYTYGSDGSGVDIYVIDEGVLPWHQEFYPKDTAITTITNEATGLPVTSEDNLFRVLTSRVLSFPGANIMANRLPGIEILDGAGNPILGGVDEIIPEARVPPLNAIAPLLCNSLNPYGFTNAGLLTHGTACASVAAGRNVGVAKGATIIPVRIFTCGGQLTVGAMISGLEWTVQSVRDRPRPAVVSMSTFFFLDPAKLSGHLDLVMLGEPLKVLNSAITTLTDMGVPVVVSANNQHGTACDTAPAILSIRAGGHVITVGGLSKNGDTAWVNRVDGTPDPGSNFGRCVDIWAPAEDIPLATMMNSSNGFAYRSGDASGTSFSAPIVAGIIARLMSENSTLYANPSNTVRKIYELLTSSATRITDSDADFLIHFGDPESPKLIAYIGAVQITTQPAPVTFGNDPNETHDLSVAVHGAGTTYQWYEGEPGNISAPRGAETSSNKTTLTAVDVPTGAIKRYWVRVKQPCRDDATVLCTADSVAATAKHGCSIDVRVDAEFLTGIRHTTATDTDVEPETPPQSVQIVARAAGAGPYHYEVTQDNGQRVACGDTQAATAGENDDPDVADESIIRVSVPSDVAATYTVTFTTGGTCPSSADGVTCSGSNTVTVSVCDQPKIKALPSLQYVWTLSTDRTFPQAVMLDEAQTTGSDQATFQWFRGTYTSFTPVYKADLTPNKPKTLERSKRPQFIPLEDGQYWARVDGRCGSAVSKPISVISCIRYTDFTLTVNFPADPVAKGRPVVLGAKLITDDGVFDAANYRWSSTAPFTSGADPSSIIVTPTDLSSPSVYHLDVSNPTGDCHVARDITITTRDCHLIALNGQPRSQTAGANGATLSVILEDGVQNPKYEWFAEPSSWTWTIIAPRLHALGTQPTFTGQAGHRYFVRVTANCANGGPQIIEDSNFASVFSVPRHRAVGPVIKSQQKGETYVILGTMNATTVLSVPAEVPGATYEWRSGDQYDDQGAPLATGTTYQVTGAGLYWVRTIPQTGDYTDSAVIRLVWNPPVPVTVSPGTVIGTNSTLHLTAEYPNPPAGTIYEWRQAVETDEATFLEDLTTPLLNSANSPELVRTGLVGHATFWVRVVVSGEEYHSDPILIVASCELLPTVVALINPPVRYVTFGAQATLFAVGTGPDLTYQWFHGLLGDTSHLISSSSSYNTSFGTDETYWVRVTDGCGQTADASINIYVCTPTIPNNVSPPDVWIKAGTSTQLSVTATPAKPGDVLHYKWYPGNLNLPALPDQTDRTLNVNYTGSFLAAVSSGCGDGGQSDVVSALMTVRVCAAPPILGLSPASHDTRLGTTEVLHVLSSGDALTYQWYRGLKDDVSNPIPDATTDSTSVQPNVDSDYWVRVTDHGVCYTDSESIHLTVCASPAIATQPASSTVFSGQTVTLTVAATPLTAAPLHYTWFEVAGDGSQEAVSGNDSPSFITAAITTPRTWFVRVYSGTQLLTYTDSQTATIQVCSMPSVLWSTSTTQVGVGTPVTLQIYAPPAGSKMYWYRGVSGDTANSTLLSGPIDSTYTQVIPAAPSTSYWVRVQKDSCYSDSSTFTVNVCVPSITQQPAGGPPITFGSSVGLSVVANTSPLTYQWYKGASGDVSQPISGATTATYTASPAADTQYWVRVTGSCGVAADSNATLVSVCFPPAITSTAPVSQWYVLGSAGTTVSVNATGSNLTYQWYFGTSGNTASPMSATASAVSVTPQNTTSYWVRVSGSCGTPQNSVTMVVNACGSPAITAQPQGSTISSGGTATMSVTAGEATSTPMTYQWYRGVSGDVSAPVAAATSTSFTTSALTATTSYWVRASCGVCNPADSQTATVTVCNNAQPLAAPADQFIAIGQTATLTATATGNIYQWYVGASGNTSQVAGGTSNQSSYNATPSVTTQYWVQIQNGVCVFRTASATVNVCVPTITQQPAGLMINPGASTTLSVAANTSGLTYQWYVGNSGTTTSPISGATGSSVSVSPSTATNYWVRVTGSCAQSVNSATATVTICSPPAIIGASPTQSIIRNNSTSCFVTATGTNLTYQWYVGTSGTTTTPISGATGSSVSVTPQNTTSYWVKVTGTCGTVNSATMLVNVCAVPTITTQPQGSVIFSGATATMSVSASEATTAPVTYQWYRGATGDVSAPVGTNSASFTTPALTAQTNYWVRVSCGVCNPADSQAATVSICYYPQNLISPGDFYNAVGQTVRLYTSNAAGNTYQWYTGATGDTSHPYTSPYSPNMYYADVAPVVTTQYWAQVQNGGCISRTAAANVYVCIPTFTQQPASTTIPPGSSTTLSSSADTPGVTYQWYVGSSGNTASPINGATGPSVTVTPGANTTYWVRAAGNCGRTTDSTAATVVLCSPPAITAQPMGSTVQGGGATGSMWVSATGSNLTYQWYSGTSGDMSYPIDGATASNASIWLQATQKVWVRITGTCGAAVNSNATFISVYPSITQPPSSLVVGYDTTATISFSASGSYLSYVWKNSMTGVVIATTSVPTLITPSITANTYIYCQVWSGNAMVNANETALTVCYNQPNISITKAPNGACSVAYVNYGSGAADDYQWYQGARGDTSHLVASGTTALYVCPTVATQYWLRSVIWSSPQVVSCYTDSNAVTLP
jgi:hypothetical protein